MLVLSRKQFEQVEIGDGIRITVLDIRKSRVRLAIEAPGYTIHRAEVPADRRRTAAGQIPTDEDGLNVSEANGASDA
ncbi:MAG: carbon storage regulator [Planctomycetales bacterium]|nr:carbon storage regulator [Planctomycetales bacterium]